MTLSLTLGCRPRGGRRSPTSGLEAVLPRLAAAANGGSSPWGRTSVRRSEGWDELAGGRQGQARLPPALCSCKVNLHHPATESQLESTQVCCTMGACIVIFVWAAGAHCSHGAFSMMSLLWLVLP